MPATKLKTRDVTGVEILTAGTFHASTGKVTVTDDELEEYVENTNDLISKGLLAPPVKLGHPKNQKLLQEEGWPAAGWVKELRLDGKKIVADLLKVPETLADFIDAGSYRKISCEFWPTGFMIGDKDYSPVITAVALLGEELPAVSNLKDMVALFETGMQPSVTLASERQGTAPMFVTLDRAATKPKPADDLDEDLVAAAEKFAEKAAEKTKGKIGAPRLRAFLDEVRKRLRELVKTEAALGDDESLQARERKINDAVQKRYGYSAWPMETYDGYVIVDREGKYFQLEYAIAESGDITLGAETEVQRSWKVKAAAAKHSYEVSGGEPEWADVDKAELPAAAFAVVDDEEKKTTWKLPHHYLSDGTLMAHAGGIRAALAALGGGRTGKPMDVPKEARAHLEEHARRAGIGDDKKEADMATSKAITSALGLPADADDAAIEAAITALKDGASKLSATEQKVQELAAKQATREATERVDGAIRACKIRPADRDFWVGFAKEKPEDFDKYAKELPALFSGPVGSEADAPDASAVNQLHKLANERIAEAAKNGGAKLTMRDAIAQVTKEQPQLARQYRTELQTGRPSASA